MRGADQSLRISMKSGIHPLEMRKDADRPLCDIQVFQRMKAPSHIAVFERWDPIVGCGKFTNRTHRDALRLVYRIGLF